MSNFFVKNEIYEERIALCRECVYYFKPTGTCKVCLCFMKVKARIGVMECPQKYWGKTTEVERPDDIPQELIEECLLIWEDVKTGVAKNVTVAVSVVVVVVVIVVILLLMFSSNVVASIFLLF